MTVRPEFATTDLLSEALSEISLAAATHCCATLTLPWAVAVAPRHFGALYASLDGDCLIEPDGGAPICVGPGEVAILLHAGRHIVRSGAEAAVIDLEDLLRQPCQGPGLLVEHGGGGRATRLIVGWIEIGEKIQTPLLAALPTKLRLAREDGADWLTPTLAALARVSSLRAPGDGALARRLTEAVLIAAIRRYAAEASVDGSGWLAALRDEQVARTLAALHADVARAWTLQDLGAIACLSRTALIERFQRRLGQSPRAYLAELRMRIAERALRAGGRLSDVAPAVGYVSLPAFSRAYRRHSGRSVSESIRSPRRGVSRTSS